MINLGLIGVGKQGSRFMQTSLGMEDVKITHTCNSRRSYKDLMANKIDGVIIAADPAMNVEMIRHANIIGLPVLCEKPAGLLFMDVQKLEKCKIPIIFNYTHLYSPLYREMKAAVRGPIGRIVSLGYNQGPVRNFSSLYDYLPHDLSMCMDLLPNLNFDIVKQQANKANGGVIYRIQLQAGETEVQIVAGNGGAEKKRQLAVFCEEQEQFLYDAANEVDKLLPLKNVMKEFVAVIGGKKPERSLDLTMKIHNILYRLGKNYEPTTT